MKFLIIFLLYVHFCTIPEALTYLGSNLVTALASLNVNDFSHFQEKRFLRKKRSEKNEETIRSGMRYESVEGSPGENFFSGAAT